MVKGALFKQWINNGIMVKGALFMVMGSLFKQWINNGYNYGQGSTV